VQRAAASLAVGPPSATPMLREPKPPDQHQVESEFELGEIRPGYKKCLCGADDPPSLARRQRQGRSFGLSP
jgi:hypothetical protein